MPLKPAILRIEIHSPHYVRFPMEDGEKAVTVHVATSWLRERAAHDRRVIDSELLLFSLYRSEVEAAASEKYDRSYCEGADVVVVAKDL